MEGRSGYGITPGNDTLRARITVMTTLKNRLLDDYNHVLLPTTTTSDEEEYLHSCCC